MNMPARKEANLGSSVISGGTVLIGDCLEPVKTWNPARDSEEETFQYIDIRSVSQDRKEIIPNGEIQTSKAPSRARQLVCAGDVLVSTVRPNLNAVAIVPEEMDGATASTGFCVLRPNTSRLSGRYLFHLVRSPSFVANLVKQATGQSYPAVSDKIVKETKILLPPLDEQKRIAAILDQADDLRRLRQRAIDRLNELGQAIFYEMFGSLIINGTPSDNSYEIVLLDDVVSFKGGGTPSKLKKEYYTGHIPWVTPKDMKFWEIVTAQDLITEEAVRDSATSLIPENSVLLVNRSGILKRTLPIGINRVPVAINQDIKALLCGERICVDFLAYFIKSLEPLILGWVRATTADNFPIDNLKDLKFPLPPIDQQQKFGDIAISIRNHAGLIQNDLVKTLQLFSSLQHRAFRGEL